ncbi:MAG: hypothetical protein MI784_12405 [Cytophagales bacterium]|nr:hypothetical protein [Cytophagales bacterium]
MLTNNMLADEQGYSTLAKSFRYTDDYLKKNDHYIQFFIDEVEKVCDFFIKKEYGEMFRVLKTTPRLKNQADKKEWNKNLKQLVFERENGTIGNVLDLLKETNKPNITEKVKKKEERYTLLSSLSENERESEKDFYNKINSIREIKYSEIIELKKYIEDKTPFSTKHGVKGAEFDNVLIICGRGWNHYNWNQYLNWVKDGYPSDKRDTFERNRNLFYVACSRAKKNLCLLFTQELNQQAINTLNNWFLEPNVKSIELD